MTYKSYASSVIGHGIKVHDQIMVLYIKHLKINDTGLLFTKLFRFRIKTRLKFQNEKCLDYFPLSVQENLIFEYIDMVNVV